MTRFRLRFLLQEFDLPSGDTLIGRGTECHITIADPLMSRKHARVSINQGIAVFHDLQSRNGSRINGRLVMMAQQINDGDRIRLGTQELVFSRHEWDGSASNKKTGALRKCGKCGLPYPEEAGACPHCGSVDVAQEDDTLTGRLEAKGQEGWALQLLVEMLEKALSLGRIDDAERVAGHARGNIEEQFRRGAQSIDPVRLDALTEAICKLASLGKGVKWLVWLLEIHSRTGQLPSGSVVDVAATLPTSEMSALAATLDTLLSGVHSQTLDTVQHQRFARLQQLRALVRGG